jgi:hypothetical protein
MGILDANQHCITSVAHLSHVTQSSAVPTPIERFFVNISSMVQLRYDKLAVNPAFASINHFEQYRRYLPK